MTSQRVPLSFVKSSNASRPAQSTFAASANAANAANSPETAATQTVAATPNAGSNASLAATSDVARLFFPMFALAATQTNLATINATLNGEETTLNLANLRALHPQKLDDLNAKNNATEQSLQTLRELADRLGQTSRFDVGGALPTAWAQLEAAVAAPNETLRGGALALAANKFQEAARLKDRNCDILTSFGFALAQLCLGDLSTALATLDEVASSLADVSNFNTLNKSAASIIFETRDVLSFLAGRPLLADYWRERADYFKRLATTGSAPEEAAYRRQAFDLAQATELLASDIQGGFDALRQAAFGASQELNREGTAVYQKTLGAVVAPKKRKNRPSSSASRSSNKRIDLLLAAIAAALAASLAIYCFFF